MDPKVVLITGCSTGIGQDAAQRLTSAGHTVVATARRLESLRRLKTAAKLALDVTQEASIRKTIARVLKKYGRIDVLVNNAGYGLRGAVEELPDSAIRRMFDVNVFGVLGMVRAVAPIMRRQGYGRIITIGSIAGRISMPVNGTYSATKFALEALCDAMRLELAAFGIKVVLLEPGNIRTHFSETAKLHSQKILLNARSPYSRLYQNYLALTARLRSHEPGPEVVSAAILKAMSLPHPKPRYQVAVPMSIFWLQKMGDGLKDKLFKKTMNIEREK